MGILRLLLAIAIVLWHCPPGVIPRILHPALAVQCFYAVSGFLIQMVILTKYQNHDRWQLRFYLSRFLRIYPLYLLFFVLTLLLLPSGFWYLWELGNGGAVLTWVANNLLIIGQDVLRFFYFSSAQKQFLVLPAGEAARAAISGQRVGMTALGQSWTLAIELYFYLLAPLLLRRSTVVLWALIAASFALRLILGLRFAPSPELLYGLFPTELGVFLLGAVAYRAYAYLFDSGRLLRWMHCLNAGERILSLICTLAVSACCWIYVACDLNFVSSYTGRRFALLAGSWDAPLSAPTGYWLVLFTTVFLLPFAFHFSRRFAFDRFVGELSYPVYISHFLVIGLTDQYLHPSPAGTGYIGASVLVFSVILSVVLAEGVEKPIDRLRHRLAGVGEGVKNDELSVSAKTEPVFRKTLTTAAESL